MKSTNLKLRHLVCSLAIVIGFSGCDAAEDSSSLPHLGVALPLSGEFETQGRSIRRGIELATDELNNSGNLGSERLQWHIEDTRSNEGGVRAAVDKLIQEHKVPAIIGPFTSGHTLVALPIANAAGVVMVGPSSSASRLSAESKWQFRVSLTVDRLIRPGFAVAADRLDFRAVARLTNLGDIYSVSSDLAFLEAINADRNLRIVASEGYVRSANEPVPDLSGIMANIMAADPDVITVSGLPLDGSEMIVQGYRAGITDTPWIYPLLELHQAQQINAMEPGAAEGAISLTVWDRSSTHPGSQAFLTNYTARYGVEPNGWAARGYVAASVMGAALMTASNYEAEAIREALANIRDLPTTFGLFSFDGDGDAYYPPLVLEVRNNQFVPIN